MTATDLPASRPLLLLVAGAKGAVATTLAAAVAALHSRPDAVRPFLSTADILFERVSLEATRMAGWDTGQTPMGEAARCQGVLPEDVCRLYADDLDQMPVRPAPQPDEHGLDRQIEQVADDIADFKKTFPGTQPVFINLLPAAPQSPLEHCGSLAELRRAADGRRLPDLAYAIAAVEAGVPVVNFTPNTIEFAPLAEAARIGGVPLAGRDGKTGQTYLKVVLASALAARSLMVDGWYSLNILGNADGRNLMEPERAAGKLANKTDLLDDILGYPVGRRYGEPTHKVHIDYYRPRGDAKEAWDVVDFSGLFDLPMSIRMNLQGRDSILAAPLALDLARWAAVLQQAGCGGPAPELGFYFKKPVGDNPPVTFADQVACLKQLELRCRNEINRKAQET
jgi:myo-inositol-1-phosphate synthase